VHHTIMIPAALSLPLSRGAAVCRAPTIFQNDWFCTRITNFLDFGAIYLNFGAIYLNVGPKLENMFFSKGIGGGRWVSQDLREVSSSVSG